MNAPDLWTGPMCGCNQPGVATHPLGHHAFCTGRGLRARLERLRARIPFLRRG